jgi:hypothetical protein
MPIQRASDLALRQMKGPWRSANSYTLMPKLAARELFGFRKIGTDPL